MNTECKMTLLRQITISSNSSLFAASKVLWNFADERYISTLSRNVVVTGMVHDLEFVCHKPIL